MDKQSILQILIVDDDQVDRMRLLRLLREGHALGQWKADEVVDVSSGLAALKSGRYDLVLLDFQLPDGSGLDFLQRMKEQASCCPAVVMQTVLDDEETSVRAVELGAQDYLIKGRFDSRGLIRAIRYARERSKLLQRQEQLVRDLQQTLSRLQTLEGILTICCQCKKIRNKEGTWQQLESYIAAHTDVRFSHGYCPECHAQTMLDLDNYEKIREK